MDKPLFCFYCISHISDEFEYFTDRAKEIISCFAVFVQTIANADRDDNIGDLLEMALEKYLYGFFAVYQDIHGEWDSLNSSQRFVITEHRRLAREIYNKVATIMSSNI